MARPVAVQTGIVVVYLHDLLRKREVGERGVPKRVYWHRELPPADAEMMEEHTIEAESVRVPGTLAYRDEVWDACHADLMRRTVQRLEQEISRLGGDCAHVLSESIEPKHNDATSEAWLQGRFEYALYRIPSSEPNGQ